MAEVKSQNIVLVCSVETCWFLLHSTLPLLFELQNSNCSINHSHSFINIIILYFTHSFPVWSTLYFSKASTLWPLVSHIEVEKILTPVQEEVTLFENLEMKNCPSSSSPVSHFFWSRISSNIVKLSTERLKRSFTASLAMSTQNLHPTHNL